MKYQRCLNKVRKCDLDIQFLHNGKSNLVYPKFSRWKNIPRKNKRYQRAFYARLLNYESKEKHQKKKDVKKELLNCLGVLNNSTTWIKAQIIKYSVNCYTHKRMTRVKERQTKKLDGLIAEKNIQDGIQNNPNNLISSLIGKMLSDTEIGILKYRLKHATALRAFTYFHIDIYDKQYYHDKKKMNIIKQLSEKVDYHDAMNQLFSDKTKFKIIKYDPSLTRLETI